MLLRRDGQAGGWTQTRRVHIAGVVMAGAAGLLGGVMPAARASSSPPHAANGPFGFATPILVDATRAGGEPSIFVTHAGTWLYTAHAATTHIYKPNVPTLAQNPGWAATYRDQTYIWRCTSGSACASTAGDWSLVDVAGTGLHSAGTGFSDPDLTEDRGGNLYHAEIQLGLAGADGQGTTNVNFSPTEGATWSDDALRGGNALGPGGDRPWLAGGVAGHVYLGIDDHCDTSAATTKGPNRLDSRGTCWDHRVLASSDEGRTFPVGSYDFSKMSDGSWIVGDGGKLVVDPGDPTGRTIYEPAHIYTGGAMTGIGIGISTDGAHNFHQVPIAADNVYGNDFQVQLAIDQAGTLYAVWDQADNVVTATDPCPDLPGYNGCVAQHPVAIRYAYSHDHGETWSMPHDVTAAPTPTSASVFWPWVVGGRGGTIGVAWYQSDRHAAVDIEPSNISVYAARLDGADTATPDIQISPADGRVVHTGTVCQTGAPCVQLPHGDRRLGDYLTATLDTDGRMVIAYAETSTNPDSPVSRPAVVVQMSGPPLR